MTGRPVRSAVRLAAVALTLLSWVLSFVPAAATSDARIAAAAFAEHLAGEHDSGDGADVAFVLRALQHAGVDTARFDSLTAPSQQTRSVLAAACSIRLVDTAPRPSGPAPGDLAVYRPVTTGDVTAPPQRVGMFVGPDDVVIFDGATERYTDVRRNELFDETGDGITAQYAQRTPPPYACRLPAALWPGGVDDTGIPAGRIALAQAGSVGGPGGDMDWAAQHPRNADPHWYDAAWNAWTALVGVLSGAAAAAGQAAAWAAAALWQALGAFTAGLPALHWLWLGAGAALGALGGVLSRSFDASGLFRAVREVVEIAIFGFGALAEGGAWKAFTDTVAGLLVTFATGLNDGQTTVFGIVVALVLDAVVLAKVGVLAGLGSRAAVAVDRVAPSLLPTVGRLAGPVAGTRVGGFVLRLAEAGGSAAASVVDRASRLSDLAGLKPSALREAGSLLTRAGDAGGAAGIAGAAGGDRVAASVADLVAETRRSLAWRAADLVSLIWRPSSLASDALGHLHDLGVWVGRAGDGGFAGLGTHLAPVAERLPASLRSPVAGVLGATGYTAEAPASSGFRWMQQASHYHSGAQYVSRTLAGGPDAALTQPPPPPVAAPPPLTWVLDTVRRSRIPAPAPGLPVVPPDVPAAAVAGAPAAAAAALAADR